MNHFKDLIVNGSMRVLGTIFGHLHGKITICGKTYDGSEDITV